MRVVCKRLYSKITLCNRVEWIKTLSIGTGSERHYLSMITHAIGADRRLRMCIYEQ